MSTKSHLPEKPIALLKGKGREQLRNCFIEEMQKADKLVIIVAFSSWYSLYRLDQLVEKSNIKNICVILGMYYFVNPPEKLYITARNINAKWQKKGIGEIKIVHSERYHGKIYCFIKDNQIFSVISVSPNLSFLHYLPEDWEEQTEMAFLIKDPETLEECLEYAEEMQSASCSDNVSNFEQERIFYIEKTPQGKVTEIYKIRLTKRL